MDDKEKIDDSIEFCNDMKRYYMDGNAYNTEDSSASKQHRDYTKQMVSSNQKQQNKIQRTSHYESWNYQQEPYYAVAKEEVSDKRGAQKIKKISHDITSLLGYTILAFLIAFFITNFIGHHTVVDGMSMEDTLHDSDILIIDKFTYHFSEPKRFDIVIFPYKQKEFYVKRVIGLPGETIQILDGRIYIDGNVLHENYGKEIIRNPGLARVPITLGEEQYFVLGDNRNHSQDSRSYDVGLIERHNIIARAWIRIYPFQKIGVLPHQ